MQEVEVDATNITHQTMDNSQFEAACEEAYSEIKERLERDGCGKFGTLEECLKCLDMISQSPLGRFLLVNKSLNGYWTHLLITEKDLATGISEDEYFSLQDDNFFKTMRKAPTAQATIKRYKIFQEEVLKECYDKELGEEAWLADIPSGVMGGLITLEFPFTIPNLVGFDIDVKNEQLMELLSEAYGKREKTKFIEANAFDMPDEYREKFDIVTSNGLSIYEESDKKVQRLYLSFHMLLKKGGLLITSFLTNQEDGSGKLVWHDEEIDLEFDEKTIGMIFADIIRPKWQCTRNQDQVANLLESAGFGDIEFIDDGSGRFPTVIARKLEDSTDEYISKP